MRRLLVIAALMLVGCQDFKASSGIGSAASSVDLSGSQYLAVTTADRLELYTVDPVSKTAKLRDTLPGQYGIIDIAPSRKWIVSTDLGGGTSPLIQTVAVNRGSGDLELKYATSSTELVDYFYMATKFHPSGKEVTLLTSTCKLFTFAFNSETGALTSEVDLVLDVSPSDTCNDMAYESDGRHLWVVSLNQGLDLVDTGDGTMAPTLVSHLTSPGIGNTIAGLANGRMVGNRYGSGSGASVTCARSLSNVVTCDHTISSADPLGDGYATAYVAHPTLSIFVQSIAGSATPGFYSSVDSMAGINVDVISPAAAYDKGFGTYNEAGTILALGAWQSAPTGKDGNVDLFTVNAAGLPTYSFSLEKPDFNFSVKLF